MVWFGSCLGLHISKFPNKTLSDWIADWSNLNDNEDSENNMIWRCFSIIWNIWLARNELIFNQKSWSPEMIINKENSLFLSQSIHNLQISSANTQPTSTRVLQNLWVKPSLGSLKLNFDGANSTSESGIGLIIRDGFGEVVVARAIPVEANSASTTEAFALFEGIKLALQLDLNLIIFEGDAKILIDSLLEINPNPPWSLRVLLSSCKNLLDRLPDYSVTFTPRSGNKVAHKLARFALSCSSPKTWSSCPNFLKDIFSSDVTDSFL
ncbi:PREDICTED: uncharacterized protein LOC104585986 [Nelumbo nucifera]|uniref:Uncharacterized protein LOC104585986 n=1 Tax=Nelumbo nucifera TaxID=4432 RepID=A0A1U7YQZ0_NELNU|nr:PREDICTED: uncharacterized protein LOC104585986 [Nelumbo nucifera]